MGNWILVFLHVKQLCLEGMGEVRCTIPICRLLHFHNAQSVEYGPLHIERMGYTFLADIELLSWAEVYFFGEQLLSFICLVGVIASEASVA